MERRIFLHSTVCFWPALLLVLGGAACAFGAESGRSADLYLLIDSRGRASVTLSLNFDPSDSALLAQSVNQTLDCTLQNVNMGMDDEEEDIWDLYGHCENAFRRRGLLVEGQLNLAPLINTLRRLGVQGLRVSITHPNMGFTHYTQGIKIAPSRSPYVNYSYSIPDLTAPAPPPLHLEFGYRLRDLLWLFGPFAAILLLPTGLTLWMRRSALRSQNPDLTVVWFGYWRFLHWVVWGMWLVWFGAVLTISRSNFMNFVLSRRSFGSSSLIYTGLYFLPPALVVLLCNILSHPVFTRLRGVEWTLRDIARQSIWSQVARLLPILFIVIGATALFEEPRLSVIWFAAAIVCAMVGTRLWLKAMDLTPNALTVGELRDSIFALAKKAGVKVQQIFILPANKGRLANAAAVQANRVVLTNYLLQHLSKREVDAVVAHELAHLKLRHPSLLLGALVLLIVLPATLYSTLSVMVNFDRWAPTLLSPLAFPALLALVVLGFLFIRRRFEYAADAQAIALTGDPEALIKGLAKITRLNLLPMHWGKWSGRLLTHPSTLRRAQAIARRGDISPERLQEILSAPDADVEQYVLPPAVAEKKVFSTTAKSRIASRVGWTIIAVNTLTPALVAHLARLEQWEGPVIWAVYFGGLVATIALFLLASNFVALWGYSDLQRRLRIKMEQEGILPEAWSGLFVGFSPAPHPRLYENFYDWDLGFLFIAGDRLCYVGEQTRFALRRDQVLSVSLKAGPPGWWRSPRLYVSWRDEERGAEGTFNLRPAYARSMLQLRREMVVFGERLQAWWGHPSLSLTPPPPLADLSTPEIGAVTSTSPRNLAKVRLLVANIFVSAMLAAGVSLLFGLSFNSLGSGTAWYVVLVASLIAIFQRLPFLATEGTESTEKNK